MKVKSESEVTQLCPTPATPWTAAYQAPPSMGFSRQEYWRELPLPSPDRGSNMSKIKGPRATLHMAGRQQARPGGSLHYSEEKEVTIYRRN